MHVYNQGVYNTMLDYSFFKKIIKSNYEEIKSHIHSLPLQRSTSVEDNEHGPHRVTP